MHFSSLSVLALASTIRAAVLPRQASESTAVPSAYATTTSDTNLTTITDLPMPSSVAGDTAYTPTSSATIENQAESSAASSASITSSSLVASAESSLTTSTSAPTDSTTLSTSATTAADASPTSASGVAARNVASSNITATGVRGTATKNNTVAAIVQRAPQSSNATGTTAQRAASLINDTETIARRAASSESNLVPRSAQSTFTAAPHYRGTLKRVPRSEAMPRLPRYTTPKSAILPARAYDGERWGWALRGDESQH